MKIPKIFELPPPRFSRRGGEEVKKDIISWNQIFTRFIYIFFPPKKNRKNKRKISGKHHQIYLRLESTNLDFFLKIAPPKNLILVSFSWVAPDNTHRGASRLRSRPGGALQWSTWIVFFFFPYLAKPNFYPKWYG